MKNKKYIVILFIAVVTAFGITFAYFGNSIEVENEFNTSLYGSTLVEEFTSPTNWKPGDTTEKLLQVENTGEVDEAVRISYVETWTSKNSNQQGNLSLSQNGNTASLIKWGNDDDWTTVEENGIVYKYYNYKISPGEETTTLLESITFNPLITNNNNCTTTIEGNTRRISCTSSGEGYDNAKYKIVFTAETIQYNKYKESWNTNVNILDSKPLKIYSNRKLSLNVGSTVNKEDYQTGYDYDSVNSVFFRYLTDNNTVTSVSMCKKNGINLPAICLEVNSYTSNRGKVLSYFGGDENNFPTDCSDDNNSGSNELTCANSNIVIGIDEDEGIFINDIENGKSCVIMAMFGIFNCQ